MTQLSLLLKLVFSVAAVKRRLVLHHCVGLFFSGPLGTWIIFSLN